MKKSPPPAPQSAVPQRTPGADAPGSPETPRLLSVGHSHHEPDAFLALLRGAGVAVVADVRSAPYSRRLPHFSRDELERALREAGIAYLFLGDRLGGRPTSTALYDAAGRAAYERIRATAAFREGLDRLLAATADGTVAMLCSEEDPLDCHRGLMITPALLERGVAALHLRRDGRLETTAELEARLLQETGLAAELDQPLFPPTAQERAEILARAYRERAGKKAFRQQAGEESG